MPEREDRTREFKRRDPCWREPGGIDQKHKYRRAKCKERGMWLISDWLQMPNLFKMAALELKDEGRRGVIWVDVGKRRKRAGKHSCSHNKDQETKDKE